MQKERVLFIDLGSDYGGIETYLRGLGRILDPFVAGYAVLSQPRLAAELRAQGMTVVCIPLLGSKWLKAVRLLLACFVVPYVLLRYGIRTVQLNGFFESLLLAPLRLTGCKTIFTMHIPFETDLYSWYRNPARWVPRFLSKHSLRFASQVICVSETIGHVARGVLREDKVRVIANWVESPCVAEHPGPTAKKRQLLFVGRLEEYKGVQLILEAMRQLPDVSLVIVGDGSYRKHLESAAQGLQVHFAGFQSDLSRYYADATVFVNPSLGPEGLPLVSLEAMAHGLPCLFSDLPVHREISNDGRAAALFPSDDSAGLSEGLKELLDSDAERQSYGRAARQMFELRYCPAAASHAYIQAFRLA